MDKPGRKSKSPEVLEHLSHFLSMFTSGLLSPGEQAAMLGLFRSLAGQCLGDQYAGQPWQSILCTGGSPVEFSLAVDQSASVSVRAVVDTQHRPARLKDIVSAMRRNADLVVPRHQGCEVLPDAIVERHLGGRPAFTAPFVAYGFRATPGKERAGRIYFKVWDQPPDQVDASLSECLHPTDLKLVRSSSIGHLPVAAVAYDFDATGLARIKVYLWIQEAAREAALDAARQLLGETCGSLSDLLDIISLHRHPLWAIPRIVIGLGFKPQGGYRDVKLSLAISDWGWSSFRQIMPAVTEILTGWGIDMSPTRPASSFRPPWRFRPSCLSCDRSPKGDSLSIYFDPVRNPTNLCSIEDLRSTPLQKPDIPTAEQRTKADQSAILQHMFDLLLNSDTCDGAAY